MRADGSRRARAWAQALLHPERRFWLIVGLITLGGAVLRVLVHDYYLPWYVRNDEANIVRAALGLRGLLPDNVYGKITGYPPLTLWLHDAAQRLAESQGRPHGADALLDMRRFIMLFNIAGIVWSALLGRHCGGALAGIVAAILWAFTPIMLDLPVLALGESLAYPLFILSALLAVQAQGTTRNWQRALASLVAATFCFLLEYRLVIAFLPGLAVLALHIWAHKRSGWRRAALWAGAGVALVVTVGAFVLSRVPVRHHEVITKALSTSLWDFSGLAAHLQQALGLAGTQMWNVQLVDASRTYLPWLTPLLEQALERPEVLPLLIFFMAVPAWLFTRARGSSPLRVAALSVTSVFLLLTLWADSAIRPYGDGVDLKQRHAIPAVSLLFVLMAAALTQIVAALPGLRLRALAATGLVIYLLSLLVGPAVTDVQVRRILPWPVIVRPWVDSNIEPGAILLYHASERWFNPVWSGIPHRKWFDWLETEDVLERPLQEWIETHKITWLLLPAMEREVLRQSAAGRALLAQLLPLREFVDRPERLGIEVVLYRLWRMQHETDIRFGEHIRLVGLDRHDPNPRPGEAVAFTFYWNAPTRPTDNYSLFLHLVAADDPRPLAQVDGNPAVPDRLTQTWDRAKETLISPRFTLTLPPDLPPGDYRVLLGLYNYETGVRLPVQTAPGSAAADAWEVMQLRIPGPDPS